MDPLPTQKGHPPKPKPVHSGNEALHFKWILGTWGPEQILPRLSILSEGQALSKGLLASPNGHTPPVDLMQGRFWGCTLHILWFTTDDGLMKGGP